MYKLSFNDFLKMELLTEFNEVHGTDYSSWTGMYKDSGYDYKNQTPISNEEDYEIYLRWHEIYSSPLAKALREE